MNVADRHQTAHDTPIAPKPMSPPHTSPRGSVPVPLGVNEKGDDEEKSKVDADGPQQTPLRDRQTRWHDEQRRHKGLALVGAHLF